MIDSLDTIVFFITAAVAILASLIVVTRRNPIYSAVFMVIFFAMIAIDFLILRAPFLAVIQVLVYGGAIMVLFLFVIMLLNLSPEELVEKVSPARKILAGLGSLALFLLLVSAIRHSPTVQNAPDLAAPVPAAVAKAGEIEAVGRSLFNVQVLAFEFVSILLLIAIIGAIYLTKRRGGSAVAAGEATKEDHDPARNDRQASTATVEKELV